MARRGVILAGGRSSRMGTDKALLSFHGQPLLDFMVKRVSEALGDKNPILVAGAYAPHPCVTDEFPGRGPLEGVRVAVRGLTEGELVLVVPVDMPLLKAETLARLFKELTGSEEALCFSDSELPCVLRVSLRLKDELAKMARADTPGTQRSFKELYKRLRTRRIEIADSGELRNLNTRKDWQEALDEFKD